MGRYETIAIAVIAAYWAVVTPVLHYAPMVEGALRPVVSTVTLGDSRPSPPPDYRHVWSGDATKLRDCDFVSMEWFLGQREGRATFVTSGFIDPPQIRTSGTLHWDGIAISLAPDEVAENSFAYVYHDCGAPWLVRTLFYDAAFNS